MPRSVLRVFGCFVLLTAAFMQPTSAAQAGEARAVTSADAIEALNAKLDRVLQLLKAQGVLAEDESSKAQDQTIQHYLQQYRGIAPLPSPHPIPNSPKRVGIEPNPSPYPSPSQ